MEFPILVSEAVIAAYQIYKNKVFIRTLKKSSFIKKYYFYKEVLEKCHIKHLVACQNMKLYNDGK